MKGKLLRGTLILSVLSMIVFSIALASCKSSPSTTTATTSSQPRSTMADAGGTGQEPSITVSPSQPGSTVGKPFLPGEVLAGLPVYPGAVGTTVLNPGFGPPSFPAGMPIYWSKRPGYQSASAQYTVQATEEDILGWYLGQLAAKGYRHSGEDGAGNGTLTSRSIPFFLPSQPLISVEVHVYTSQNTLVSPVFELLVTYTVPLPKPSEERLPGDIDSVQIDYAPGAANEVVKTITDAQAVKSLVSMVNDLPVRPDYIILGGPGLLSGPQTLFRLVFHSAAEGDITVADILGGNGWAIHMGDYPILDDTHGLLQEAVEQMLGIRSTSS